MASSPHSNSAVRAEPAKMEQLITEFFAETLSIILGSRSPGYTSLSSPNCGGVSSPLPSSPSPSRRDKCFNLVLNENCNNNNLDVYRSRNLGPLVVDVILVQQGCEFDNERNFEFDGEDVRSQKVIERWVVQYESGKSKDCGNSGSRRGGNTSSAFRKKLILLLRSLYLTVRLLPAYKIFHELNSSGQTGAINLTYRVSSCVVDNAFSCKEVAGLQRFSFTPLETSRGRLCAWVVYRSYLGDVTSGPSTTMSPQFISDYVGSPLADPLKRFPSLPISRSLPSSSPFLRHPSFSPSLMDSDSRSSVSNPSPHRFTPVDLHVHSPEMYIRHKKNASYDEYSPSPNYTPSTSPSPPMYVPGNVPLRLESAPVRVGTTKLAKSRAPVQTGATVEKPFSLGKDDTRKDTGLKKSSNSSPQISLARNFSSSFHDDFDDCECLCPFDVEYDDMADPGSRPESFVLPEPGGSFASRQSQGAAVGALVTMLKKAPPLCQDLNQSSEAPSVQQVASSRIASSSFIAPKTTADALEELQGYREMMKDLLLKQASRSSTSTDPNSSPKPPSSALTGF